MARSKTFKLILASRSPRRKQILGDAGFECTTIAINSSESFSKNLTLRENLRRIVFKKIRRGLDHISQDKRRGKILLAADTTVLVGSRILGKPKDRLDAMRMLRLLSGKKHRVITCFSLFECDSSRQITRVVTTKVQFRKLSESLINWYVDTGEPFDKAGSYAVQGLAQEFIILVDGDLQNVIGLPLAAVREELRKQRWNVLQRRASSKNSRKNSRS